MADAGGPLSELQAAIAQHVESLQVKLSELVKRPDPDTAQTASELEQILDELRGLLR